MNKNLHILEKSCTFVSKMIYNIESTIEHSCEITICEMINHCEHIDWIDGAKGIAILSVILLHSLPCLNEIGAPFHIGQAVSLFIFITAFLTSFRYTSFVNYYSLSRIGKMLKRVFVPFLIVLTLQILFCQLGGNWWSWKSIIKQGGIGPGSYYVWLYLQVWFMLPFIVELVKRVPVWLSLSLMLVASIFTEYLFVLMPHFEHIESLYRLLPIRYLMVIYLGCLWSKLSKNYKKWFYVLSFFSAVLLFVDMYFADLQLITIVPPHWQGCHWYTSFYVLVFVPLLSKIQYPVELQVLGKNSWYVFLLQMMCFGF